LPPGFVVKGKKQNQSIIIYEPWAQEIRKLALRAQALDWDMGKLNKEVARKVFLFPEIPEEDRERPHSVREDFPLFACYQDVVPKLDGHYLLSDYDTTLRYVKAACDTTARGRDPLYALWLLSEHIEDLICLLDGDLQTGAVAVTMPVISSQA